MNLTDEWLAQLNNPSLTADEKSIVRCRLAADAIHVGQYETAKDYLGQLWNGVGQRPNLKGLKEPAQAEVLLQCGSLTGWLGSTHQIEGAQEQAKDLLSEALRIFTKHGKDSKAAEAGYEMGMCYWRLGAYDEARIVLQEALQRVGDVEQKAKILIRSAVVETCAARYREALRILDEGEQVFSIADDSLKGKWHAEKGLALLFLGSAENPDYFDRAIIEFTAAIYHFDLAKHERYCGNNLNNLAFLLFKLGRYREAHEHLDRAQKIFANLKDPGNLAQVNETRARVLLAESRYNEALEIIKTAIRTLERGGEQALLADALTVRAIILARLQDHYRSMPFFRQAINLAEDSGALSNAGLAALSMIEEHKERLSPTEIYNLYRRADNFLKKTQDLEIISRLRLCARAVMQKLSGPHLHDKDFTLTDAMRAYEARFIEQALKESDGSVSRAARKLGLNHQTLAYLINKRHRHLLDKRTPIINRRSSIIKNK